MLSRISRSVVLSSNFRKVNVPRNHLISSQTRWVSDKSTDAGFLRKFMSFLQPKQKDQTPEVIPADYKDPHSLSGNPTMMTVPVHAAPSSTPASEAEQLQTTQSPSTQDKSLKADEHEGGVYHHHDVATSSTKAPSGQQSLGQIDPRIMISMNCDACDTQLIKSMSKKSYTEGVVLIRCDGCKSVHLIADNLGWFDDENINIEDIMREKGEEVLRGTVDDGFDNLSPELVEKLREAAQHARESDLNVPIGGAPAMKELERRGSDTTTKSLP